MIKRNPTYVFLIIFIILKHLNYPSSIINRNPTYFFFIIYLCNFKTFKLSFKYDKQKSYLPFFFINYLYNFKTFKLFFKYHKQKSYFRFLIIFVILKHLNYPSSIINRNTTSFFYKLFL